MKKRLISIVMMAVVLFVAIPSTADAAEIQPLAYSERSENYGSKTIERSYYDPFGKETKLYATGSASAVIQWEEGIAGWIVSASFSKPTATYAGESQSVSYDGVYHQSGNRAYQDFVVDTTTVTKPKIVSMIMCDEYGDSSFSFYWGN